MLGNVCRGLALESEMWHELLSLAVPQQREWQGCPFPEQLLVEYFSNMSMCVGVFLNDIFSEFTVQRTEKCYKELVCLFQAKPTV